MLINLDYWRQNNVYERVMEFIKINAEKVNYLDQDAMNAILVDRWIDVPAIWNDQARSTLHVPAVRNQNIQDPAIVHFLGPYKPWNWLCKHPFNYEYHKYRRKTPWRRYRQEGKPHLHSLRIVARAVLPRQLRRWLRSRLTSVRA
jgi:lipopolysaccharide biosynthesis glycosyltransferase